MAAGSKRKPRYSDGQLEAAIIKGGGFVSFAARSLGMSRQHLYKRIEQSDRLKEVLEEVREEAIDTAELALRNQVIGGNIAAIIFTLKTLGKHRGFVERQEVQSVGEPVPVRIVEDIVETGRPADGQ